MQVCDPTFNIVQNNIFEEIHKKKVLEWPNFHILLNAEGKIFLSCTYFVETHKSETIVMCTQSIPMDIISQIVQRVVTLQIKQVLDKNGNPVVQ
jgi:hypothetical protein